jgi:high affinity sulfate transporter 1
VVPKSLGYASIAGVPIQHGLYAAAAGAIIYALFGTSKQVATGPSSALAAVAAGAVVGAGLSGGSDEAVAMVAAITVGSGLMFLVLAILKMGWISQLLSKAVITGFLFGAAIQVVVGELFKLTGTAKDGDNAWRQLGEWIRSLTDTDPATFAIGVAALVLIVGLRFALPKVPGALVLVVVGIAASAVFDLASEGVAVVGDVPSGLPSVAIPDVDFVVDNIAVILTASIGLLLIGFSQTAGDARAFAAKHRYQVDINQESVAQGMANIGSGLVQGIPVSTSLSASSLSDQSGARTQVASLTTGAVAVLTMLFLAPVFSDLPEPVLAAIIIDAVVFGMIDIAQMKRLFTVNRPDFWIAVAAILGVLTAGVLAGVIIGVLLSIFRLVFLSTTPDTKILGRWPDTQAFGDTAEHDGLTTYPGLLVLRFDASLFFATSDPFEDEVRTQLQVADPAARVVVIDFEGVDLIDAQGSSQVRSINTLVQAHGAQLRLARMKSGVRRMLERDGVVDLVGAENIYPNVYESVADLLPDGGVPPSEGS